MSPSRPDTAREPDVTALRITTARRDSLAELAAIRERVVGLKLLRQADPVGATNALRDIRGHVHALLGELDR